jgi:hypothetical protein
VIQTPDSHREPQQIDPRELICIGCGRSPTSETIRWSTTQNRAVHVAAGTPHPSGLPRMCGGIIVRREETWEGCLQPGMVVRCLPSKIGRESHFVRLGRTHGTRNNSWTGTSLCEVSPSIGYWVPLAEERASQFRTCPVCEKLRKRHPE